MQNKFICSRCAEHPSVGQVPQEARWLAWYRTTGGLYNYLCNEHAKNELEDTELGLVCLRSIDDAIYKHRKVNEN